MKFQINFYWLLLLGSLCHYAGGQSISTSVDILDKWEDSETRQPGISVAIIEAGKTTYKKSVGYSNLEYQIPLDDNSIFDIASLAKQFTGFAIAKLILDDKLKLNDPVVSFLPNLEILNKGILIKHLVYHTSGLRDVGELFALSNQGEIFTSKEALVLAHNQIDLNFDPGAEYGYSNTNYVLLALIVEQVTGQSFREWCEINIFSPLKMERSFVNDNPYELIHNRAVAYYTDKSSFSFNQNNGMSLIGSSAVYSNLNDMIIWTQALQENLMFPDVFKFMKKKGQLDNGDPVNYGFGLSIDLYQGTIMIEHSGATPAGFRTLIVLVPEKQLSFIVLSNWGDIDPIDNIGREILDFFFPNPEAPVEVSKNSLPIHLLSKESAMQCVGEYLFNQEMVVSIRSDDKNNLTIQLEGQEEVPLITVNDTTFEIPALRSTLTFHSDGKDVYDKASVLMGGNAEGTLQRRIDNEKISLDYRDYEGLFLSIELNIVFKIQIHEGQLNINNTKMGKVQLIEKTEEIFVPTEGVASSIVFTFNNTKEVNGFLLNRGSRARDLKFTKLAAL